MEHEIWAKYQLLPLDPFLLWPSQYQFLPIDSIYWQLSRNLLTFREEHFFLAICIAYSEAWLYLSELFVLLLLYDMVGDHLPPYHLCLWQAFLCWPLTSLFLWCFPTIRHNEIHANSLSQVCSNVKIGPRLQPLSCKTLSHCTSHSYRKDGKIKKRIIMKKEFIAWNLYTTCIFGTHRNYFLHMISFSFV